MEGIRPWRINELALCEALIEDPRKAWHPSDLMQVSGLIAERADEVLYELQRLGAVEYFWDPPRPARPVHPLDAHSSRSRRLVRLTEEGSVLLWEGWSHAVAVWQAKRREASWKRSQR